MCVRNSGEGEFVCVRNSGEGEFVCVCARVWLKLYRWRVCNGNNYMYM